MRHPFKDFTRKRNGRVGTRFRAVSARSDHGVINYDGEMMLADWQEKPGTGMTVKFWLDDEASLHPYAGCTRRKSASPGEMFALTLVELTDADEVQHQDGQKKRRSLSQDAHLMVTSEMFVQYLREMVPSQAGWDQRSAKDYAKAKMGVESLSELDHNPEKRALFFDLVRRPYAKWNGVEV